MIAFFYAFLLITATLAIFTPRVYATVFYLDAFSLLAMMCFLLLAAPDVAFAEAVVSTISTILYLVAISKRFGIISDSGRQKWRFSSDFIKLLVLGAVMVLFIYFIPEADPSALTETHGSAAKDLYIKNFADEVGGENSITAIYLGYRVYDTVFEALMLLISIFAIVYLSWSWSDHKNEIEEGSNA